MTRTGGVILCGGESSRMGRPKCWLPLAGGTMLGRVVSILEEVVSPLVVVAAPDQDVPPLPGSVEVVRDPVRGRGPLQGIAVGLTALEGRADAAYISGCDSPFLQPAFVRRMVELLGDHDIAVPAIDGYRFPLSAVYHVSVALVARELIAAGQSRPAFLFDRVPTRFVWREDLPPYERLQSLRNVNTPDDYEAAVWELGA